ncbi:MAG: TssQ family T6SS-associated lipoprotein [Betaproteobacteria bacterium]|nr:TssQ family T6SS-associated lipoprotein [Betaproteobacteria bacterium]
MNVERTLILAVTVTVLYGCAAIQPDGEPSAGDRQEAEQDPAAGLRKGERNLAAGIRNYEDGEYNQAAKTLEASLKFGLSDSDQVTAHKYLAFIYCASERAAKCRGHFRMALTIDPALELAPAEAGHPVWGPVFRSVKTQH